MLHKSTALGCLHHFAGTLSQESDLKKKENAKVFVEVLCNQFECVENQHWSIWLQVLSG